MDLLYQRYASPFSFIDGYMQTGRFDEFVVEFVNAINKEKEHQTRWDFYLHKVSPEVSFDAFIEEAENNKQNLNMSDEEKAETVKMAMNILNNFNPERGE